MALQGKSRAQRPIAFDSGIVSIGDTATKATGYQSTVVGPSSIVGANVSTVFGSSNVIDGISVYNTIVGMYNHITASCTKSVVIGYANHVNFSQEGYNVVIDNEITLLSTAGNGRCVVIGTSANAPGANIGGLQNVSIGWQSYIHSTSQDSIAIGGNLAQIFSGCNGCMSLGSGSSVGVNGSVCVALGGGSIQGNIHAGFTFAGNIAAGPASNNKFESPIAIGNGSLATGHSAYAFGQFAEATANQFIVGNAVHHTEHAEVNYFEVQGWSAAIVGNTVKVIAATAAPGNGETGLTVAYNAAATIINRVIKATTFATLPANALICYIDP